MVAHELVPLQEVIPGLNSFLVLTRAVPGQSQVQLRTRSTSLGNARHDCGVKPGPDAMEEALN